MTTLSFPDTRELSLRQPEGMNNTKSISEWVSFYITANNLPAMVLLHSTLECSFWQYVRKEALIGRNLNEDMWMKLTVYFQNASGNTEEDAKHLLAVL